MIRGGSSGNRLERSSTHSSTKLFSARLLRRFRRAPLDDELKPKAKPETRSSEMLQGALRMLARGLDHSVEAALSIPTALFFSEGSGARFYSQAENHSLPEFLACLRMGRLVSPKTPYGIILFETTNNVNFVLFDLKRRIVVRETLLSHECQSSPADWPAVKSHVDSAAALASTDDAREKGLFAVHISDGQCLLMKIG